MNHIKNKDWNFPRLCFSTVDGRMIGCSWYQLLSIPAPARPYLHLFHSVLICMWIPHFSSQTCHRDQTHKTKELIWHPNFFCSSFPCFTADLGALSWAKCVIWDGKHLILTEFKQEIDTEENPVHLFHCQQASTVHHTLKIYMFLSV